MESLWLHYRALNNQKIVPTSLVFIAFTHLKASGTADGSCLDEALSHARSAFEIISSIAPNDDFTIQLKQSIEWMTHPFDHLDGIKFSSLIEAYKGFVKPFQI